jgi:hypothetical protein
MQDMSPIAADAIKDVAKSTHAIPAREETKRAWLATTQHYGTLALVLVIAWLALPKLANPSAVLALALLLALILAAERIIKAIRG